MSGEPGEDELPIAPGTRIGPYVVESFLARGGMGMLLRAHDEKLDRPVAIKIIDPRFADDSDFRARFERECKVLARLNHPNVVGIYFFDDYEGAPYFAMELVEGSSLERVIQDVPRLDWRKGVKWMQQCCGALEAARRKGVIHRDLKPANILLDVEEQIRIVDFGLAKPTQVSSQLTAAAMVVGTPHYMSPEQAKGDELDWRSDLYSLGATFYHVFSGRTVFDSPSAMEIVSKHICELPKELSTVRTGLPASLCEMVDKLLAKDPGSRGFSAYREVRRALQRILDTEEEAAERTGGSTMVLPKAAETEVAPPESAARTLAPGEAEPAATPSGAKVSATAATVEMESPPTPPPEPVFRGELYAWMWVDEADREAFRDVALVSAQVVNFGRNEKNAIHLPNVPQISNRGHGAFAWYPGGYRVRPLKHRRKDFFNDLRFAGDSSLKEGDHPVGPGTRLDLRGRLQLNLAGSHEKGLRVEYQILDPELRRELEAKGVRGQQWVLVLESAVMGTGPECGVRLPSGTAPEEVLRFEVDEDGWHVVPLAEGCKVDGKDLVGRCPLPEEHLLEGPGFRYHFRAAYDIQELNEH